VFESAANHEKCILITNTDFAQLSLKVCEKGALKSCRGAFYNNDGKVSWTKLFRWLSFL